MHLLSILTILAISVPAMWLPAHAAFPGRNGRIAFVSYRDGNAEIYAMESDGANQTNLTNDPADDSEPAWSPDGSRIAFVSNRGGSYDLYVMHSDGSDPTALTSDADVDQTPTWSPDGTQIAFARGPMLGSLDIWRINADGTDLVQLTYGVNDSLPAWSPDGSKIAFSSTAEGGYYYISLMDPDGSNQAALTDPALDDWDPEWSPDSSKVAFTAMRDFVTAVWVMNADGSGEARLTPGGRQFDAGDSSAAWSPDGSKIAYQGDRDRDLRPEILTINADGTGITQLTSEYASDVYPAWQPIGEPLTYMVNTTDSDVSDGCTELHCSLREAILEANWRPSLDTIAFAIGDEPVTIQPASGLPTITDPVIIDGTTQPGYVGSPIVELDGSNAGDTNGLTINAGGSTVRGLVINRFAWAGIALQGGKGGSLITGNYIGMNQGGSMALGNAAGVYISGSSDNIIQGNVISGNNGDGVLIEGADNVLQGNYIGTDATGMVALGNSSRGVVIDGGATNNIIGGAGEGAGNVISANGAAGVRIGDPGTMGNKLQGNYIGTDNTGTIPLGNWYVGVRIAEGATDNLIGGSGAGASNVISGNKADGVLIDGEGTSSNMVQGNYIGTDRTGTTTIGAGTPAVGNFTVTVEPGSCPTYPAKTDFDGFMSQSDDPLAPWSGTSVTFKGTDECTGAEMLGAASLIYRYRLVFDEVTQLNSVAVSGAAFNGPDSVLRVLDGDMNLLGTAETGGGNSYGTSIVSLEGVEGTVFYVEEFDTSSAWRFRQSFLINAFPLGNLGNGVLLAGGATENLIGGADAGNVISGNYANGVAVFNAGTNRNRVQGNYIGTDAGGTHALGNHAPGVGIGDQASNNLVGGSGAGNVISGNSGPGVAINNPGTVGNVLQSNYVGTDKNGTAAVPNTGMGIWLGDGASDTLIGGTVEGEGNLISGNASEGISLNDYRTTGTRVLGNYIGIDRDGASPLPNGAGGVIVRTTATYIGGTEPGAGNVISGNNGNGIDLQDGASAVVLQGNLVGMDATGTKTTGPAGPAVGKFTITTLPETCPTYPAGTEFDGFVSQSDDPAAPWSGTSVRFRGTDECADREKLGEASLVYRYRIEFHEVTQLSSIAVTGAAFNGPDSVLRVLDENLNILATTGTNGGNSNWINFVTLQGVEGKVFYVDEFDTSMTWRFRQSIVINGGIPLGNLGNGVLLANGASDNRIGGVEPSARNVISGNMANGVGLFNPTTEGNHILGNYIGTDITGTQALGNHSSGVAIGDQASSNLIGDVEAPARNLISGNMSDGIAIFNSGTTYNTVMGNYIGTDVNGTAALPNAGVGVWIGEGASDTRIGGAARIAGNLISGNAVHGVSINHPQTTGTLVQGNYIGTDASGTTALPNGAGGVYVSATRTLIGGTAPEAGNVISGNNGTGIDLQEGASGNYVQGNLIGTDRSGTLALGNLYSGIFIASAGSNNTIGGPGSGNTIAFNTWTGIATAGDAGQSNAFLANSVLSNGALGIDLGADGVTLNDPRDRDVGPNNLQNFPVLGRPKMVDGMLRVLGELSSSPNTTYRIEFFSVPACDDSGYGEGQVFLGSGQVVIGPSGRSDFSFELRSTLLPGELVTATATDSVGNTSEFAKCAGPAK